MKLSITTPSDLEIRMTRTFNAPRALVFDAFTQPELLKRWFFGPSGWWLDTCEVDLKVGGTCRYVWKKPGGYEMGMTWVIRELTPPAKLVATERFDDEWYAGESIGTIELVESDGKTTLTQTLQYESKEARDTVLRSPMESGVTASYDRLSSVLEELTLHAG